MRFSPKTADDRTMAATSAALQSARLGIDLGGTKIEGIVLDGAGQPLARRRIPAPRGDYEQTLSAISALVTVLESMIGRHGVATGIGIPGSISKRTGLVHNANSTWLNGRDLARDLCAKLNRPVSISNDANCFALSEARDGAAAGCGIVFGVILGTGTGGGLAIGGQIVDGPLGIAGEWGHNPLPWGTAVETPGPACWCGLSWCMETWVSGPALTHDYARVSGSEKDAFEIASLATAGDTQAIEALDRHASRLARGLAHVVNIIDPDVIVLGGGLSNLAHLYDVLPALIRPHIFADDATVDIRPPRWGDASGVRGAAWLADVF
jgi:fructokinase